MTVVNLGQNPQEMGVTTFFYEIFRNIFFFRTSLSDYLGAMKLHQIYQTCEWYLMLYIKHRIVWNFTHFSSKRTIRVICHQYFTDADC